MYRSLAHRAGPDVVSGSGEGVVLPNWQASGADGPWRVTPNQMVVVVPTARTVTLRYGRTPVDHAGWAATLAGIGGLGLLARRRAPGDGTQGSDGNFSGGPDVVEER